jgi:hypothetical protein
MFVDSLVACCTAGFGVSGLATKQCLHGIIIIIIIIIIIMHGMYCSTADEEVFLLRQQQRI